MTDAELVRAALTASEVPTSTRGRTTGEPSITAFAALIDDHPQTLHAVLAGRRKLSKTARAQCQQIVDRGCAIH